VPAPVEVFLLCARGGVRTLRGCARCGVAGGVGAHRAVCLVRAMEQAARGAVGMELIVRA
jgi:hypothetical protein